MTKHILLISCAIGAIAAASGGARAATADAGATSTANAAAQPSTTVSDIVVTAERREENLQSTPIQVSAFNQAVLSARRIDGGENLEQQIPNVNYSRTFYGGYSLEIRGVGSQTVGGGGEQGVAINENSVTMENNYFQNTDFYDTERVEIERGPQGTLYGRAATAGAVNIITNKPTDTFGGSVTGEYGSFNEGKFTGFLNVPLNDAFSARLAGFYLTQGGFGHNLTTGQTVDGRNLYSGRITLGFKPNDHFRAYLMYEHYGEDDDRNTVGKQLCTPDAGPASVGGVPTTSIEQGFLSQGCQNATIYSRASYGVTNSSADLAGIYAEELGLLGGNANAGHPLQDTNLHDIAATMNPINEAHQDIAQLDMTWDFTDNLSLESITAYNGTEYFYQRDYNRFQVNVPFGTTPAAGCLACIGIGPAYNTLYQLLFPGGVVNDPQVGPSNRLLIHDQGDGRAEEWTQEVRLSSSFKGPVNFSVGAMYFGESDFAQYYVFFNPLTALEQLGDTLNPGAFTIDPSNPPHESGPLIGHNYYLNSDLTRTQSFAGFGELYYDITPTLRLTVGVRETDDRKWYSAAAPVLGIPGGGAPLLPAETSNTLATSGRVILAWTPQTSFSDHTMIYGSFSRGYKAAGFNTPCQSTLGCSYSPTSAPEYDNAFELGTKNIFMGGRLMLNLAGFYDLYQGYQIATIVDKSSVNQNINANIYGAELESVWTPVDRLTFNANVGWLHTEITGGDVLDQMNLTQGDPNLTLIKSPDGSNCVVTTAGLAAYLHFINTMTVPPGVPGSLVPGVQEGALLGTSALVPGGSAGICGGQYGNSAPYFGPAATGHTDPFNLYAYAPSQHVVTVDGVGQGVNGALKGNRLPNAPDWTVSVGGQYIFELPSDWTATLRGDFYWQDFSYARIFDDTVDYLKSWDNVNATLTFASKPLGLNVQLFVKNAFNAQPITTTAVGDASTGLLVNSFTLDPRTFGVNLTKRF